MRPLVVAQPGARTGTITHRGRKDREGWGWVGDRWLGIEGGRPLAVAQPEARTGTITHRGRRDREGWGWVGGSFRLASRIAFGRAVDRGLPYRNAIFIFVSSFVGRHADTKCDRAGQCE
jgi:hypothetical protein